MSLYYKKTAPYKSNGNMDLRRINGIRRMDKVGNININAGCKEEKLQLHWTYPEDEWSLTSSFEEQWRKRKKRGRKRLKLLADIKRRVPYEGLKAQARRHHHLTDHLNTWESEGDDDVGVMPKRILLLSSIKICIYLIRMYQ